MLDIVSVLLPQLWNSSISALTHQHPPPPSPPHKMCLSICFLILFWRESSQENTGCCLPLKMAAFCCSPCESQQPLFLLFYLYEVYIVINTQSPQGTEPSLWATALATLNTSQFSQRCLWTKSVSDHRSGFQPNDWITTFITLSVVFLLFSSIIISIISRVLFVSEGVQAWFIDCCVSTQFRSRRVKLNNSSV